MSDSTAVPLVAWARRWCWWRLVALAPIALLALAACDSSDDEERLAAQRFFRNVLLQPDDSAAADVRIQGFVDTLPPDFPLPDGLTLLGSGFSDTQQVRELIVGWESDQSADEIYDFYREALDVAPWSIEGDPRFQGIDFLSFADADNLAFNGELRIAQEGDQAVVVLIAREDLGGPPNDPRPAPSGAAP
jgi:hypothetical protein